MIETYYLVTFDGWTEGYGSCIYALGLYRSEEEAEEAIRESDIWDTKITELAVGDTLPATKNSWGEWTTSEYLGGYCE